MPAKLYSRFPQIAATLPVVMGKAAERTAKLVADRAAERAPDRPPYGEGLVAAIHTEPVEHHPGSWWVVGGDDDHWYGHFLEWGTSRASPRPFMGPAAEETRDEMVELARAGLQLL